jgi:hypothetical protein
MLSCKEATRLVSEQLDRELPFWKRFSLRLHVAMCRACSRYMRQVEALDGAVSEHYRSEQPAQVTERLSDDALERIAASLRAPRRNSNRQKGEP